MYCGPSMPGRIVKTFTDALKVTFPVFSKSDDLKRFDNAYRDTLFLYEITNPTKPIFYEMALIKDMDENYRKRRITLFYTEKLPEDIDYLNLNHSKWSHPCDNKDIRNSSFPEIYETALKDSEPVLSRLLDILKTITDTREVSEDAFKEMEREIGNTDLESDRTDLTRCIPQYSNPLPLYKILDTIYKNAKKHYSSISYSKDEE